MNMTITESDKKLLSILAAFLIAVLFIFLVYRPLAEKNEVLKDEIARAKEQEISMDMAASLAEDMVAKEQATKEKMTQVVQRFYPILESQQAENMVTVLMLNHKLDVQNLSIVMPEKQSGLKWYQYSEKAVNVAEQTEDGDTKPQTGFGVYTARVSCTAEGSMDDMKALLDDVSSNYPAISILSAEWSSPETTGSMTISFEIFMCEQ